MCAGVVELGTVGDAGEGLRDVDAAEPEVATGAFLPTVHTVTSVPSRLCSAISRSVGPQDTRVVGAGQARSPDDGQDPDPLGDSGVPSSFLAAVGSAAAVAAGSRSMPSR